MPTDRPPRRSLVAWLIPIGAFVAGVAVTMMVAPKPAPAPEAAIPTFGVAGSDISSGAGVGTPDDSLLQMELGLFRDINDQFVEQLRRYETRLRAIANAAAEEGAPQSADLMREFALETELLIDRYDLILKNK